MLENEVVMDKGLFENWLDIELKTKEKPEVIEDLNIACDMKYKMNYISKMKSTGYSLERIPVKVRRYMMKIVLLDKGVSDDEADDLIISLT